MEDKKQDVKSLEELLKAADEFRKWAVDFGNELSKVLADIQTSKKEEDTWEIKCPYEENDYIYILYACGGIDEGRIMDGEYASEQFYQGNVFQTRQAAELEAKRRNLLTRFRAFRDECNGDWKINWDDVYQDKHIIKRDKEGNFLVIKYWTVNEFNLFGYFKDYKDAKRAIELFGDEIKALFVDCEG